MDEQKTIDDAYLDAIRGIYDTLSTEIQLAKGDARQEAAAEARFSTGIAFARRIHAMASGLIGKPPAS